LEAGAEAACRVCREAGDFGTAVANGAGAAADAGWDTFCASAGAGAGAAAGEGAGAFEGGLSVAGATTGFGRGFMRTPHSLQNFESSGI